MRELYTLKTRPGTEHGQYETSSFNQVLTFSARGPWNDETLRRGTREMGEIIERLDHNRPWCQISCLYGESLMQPSVFDYFVKQTHTRRKMGLAVLAVVIKDSDIESTIKQQLSHAYTLTNIEFEFFSDIASAMKMLDSSGFEIDWQAITRFFTRNDFSNTR